MIHAADTPGIPPKRTQLQRALTSPRHLFSLTMTGLTVFATGISLVPLVAVLVYVTSKGIQHLRPEVFIESTPAPLSEGGGIGNAILGTLITVGIAALFSIPLGVLAATFLSEFARDTKFALVLDFLTNVLSGVPSIVIGVFAYSVVVLTTKGYSALAGGFALGILMVPTIIRTAAESMEAVPDEVRQAAVSLGATQFQTTCRVVLPIALPAITTGVMLAIARAAGETAPILFTALFSQFWFDPQQGLMQPIATLSVLIFNFATVPFENQKNLAWAASFLLVMLVLITSVLSRAIVGKQHGR